MQIADFKDIIETFSDPGSELLFQKNKIVFSVNGSVIEATIEPKHGDIFVDEAGDGNPMPASLWIIRRLANLPLLANRLSELTSHQESFVSPAANFLPSLESKRGGDISRTDDALSSMLDALDEKSPLETTVLYLTSDAGEGKTYLINAAAKEQAKRFSAGKKDWLLVPIPLGGRHFLRFDDIAVGALQNRYRFPFLHYKAFLALVKMGVVVPAFDGFEEMFVENSSGEALSAMGILVGALNSTGTVVVAARKAYFEFENLRSQEKLYESISAHSVGFAKFELIRWEKEQFLAYCKKREVKQPDIIYQKVCEQLQDPEHSLLTRPVLVRRLVDIAKENGSLDSFLEKIHSSGADFFSVFIRGIVDREATEKWIDRSGGDIGQPLLTTDEHCELLSSIAVYMWESRVDYVKRDHLDVVSDIFCEIKRKSTFQSQQIRERIRGHALLIASPNVPQSLEFDHDEFRLFFLGEGLSNEISTLDQRAKRDAHRILKQSILPETSRLAFIRSIGRNSNVEKLEVAQFLIEVGQLDGQASYTQENCGDLAVRFISGMDAKSLLVNGLAFSANSLRDCHLKNVTFQNCYFSQGSLERTSLDLCSFKNCRFSQIKLFKSTIVEQVSFSECEVGSLWFENSSIGMEIWNPTEIQHRLEQIGVNFSTKSDETSTVTEPSCEVEDDLLSVEKLLRYFMRSTHISESVIKIKLGDRGQTFIDEKLPQLLSSGVLCEIANRGGTNQRRFRLGLPLDKINSSFSSAKGSYTKFLDDCHSEAISN